MTSQQSFRWINRLFTAVLAITVCGAQSLPAQTQAASTDQQADHQTANQQTSTPSTNSPDVQTGSDAQSTPQNIPATPVPQNPQLGNSQSAMPDPSRGPQTPTRQSQPVSDSNSTPQAQPGNTTGTTQTQTPAYQEPSGAATAERGITNGGAASRPAGTAIAPAKQRRVRSLVIKIGAIAAGAAAIGSIYALSRGTSSLPPGAHTAGASRP